MKFTQINFSSRKNDSIKLFKPFFILLLIIFSNLVAIDLNLPPSAAHNATNGLSLILQNPSSGSLNPAICNPGIETSATYLFGLKELPYYNFHSAFRFKNFGFLLGNSYLDHKLYRENIVNLAVNYNLQKFSFGLNFRHLYNRIENYQKDSSIIFDAGLKWENNKIITGFSVRNFLQSSFLKEQLPIFYLWETCYHISSKSKISIGLEKQDNFDFSFKIAGSYNFFRILTILTSYQYEPDRIGIGAVFNLKKIKVTYSIRTQQYLDLTHYISVGYALRK